MSSLGFLAYPLSSNSSYSAGASSSWGYSPSWPSSGSLLLLLQTTGLSSTIFWSLNSLSSSVHRQTTLTVPKNLSMKYTSSLTNLSLEEQLYRTMSRWVEPLPRRDGTSRRSVSERSMKLILYLSAMFRKRVLQDWDPETTNTLGLRMRGRKFSRAIRALLTSNWNSLMLGCFSQIPSIDLLQLVFFCWAAVNLSWSSSVNSDERSTSFFFLYLLIQLSLSILRLMAVGQPTSLIHSVNSFPSQGSPSRMYLFLLEEISCLKMLTVLANDRSSPSSEGFFSLYSVRQGSNSMWVQPQSLAMILAMEDLPDVSGPEISKQGFLLSKKLRTREVFYTSSGISFCFLRQYISGVSASLYLVSQSAKAKQNLISPMAFSSCTKSSTCSENPERTTLPLVLPMTFLRQPSLASTVSVISAFPLDVRAAISLWMSKWVPCQSQASFQMKSPLRHFTYSNWGFMAISVFCSESAVTFSKKVLCFRNPTTSSLLSRYSSNYLVLLALSCLSLMP